MQLELNFDSTDLEIVKGAVLLEKMGKNLSKMSGNVRNLYRISWLLG